MSEDNPIPPERLPRHIAIIMDGNGRWACQRGQPRIFGHQHGAETVRKIVTACAKMHREYGNPTHLTLYSFSTENWKRPADEVAFLMEMYVHYLEKELPTLMDNNIRFHQIGRLEGLPEPVLQAMRFAQETTGGNTGITLNLAVNYGSRAEMVNSVQAIACEVKNGSLAPGDITEEMISGGLYTASQPDPDLLIRTAGEMRLSNFLLWQLSYAELYVTPTLWPDFGEKDLELALRSYAGRDRRFGAL